MAFLWHQRRQSRKSCRCRDGLAQWELQETPRKFVPPPPGRCAEQCPSPPGFHLWEPSSSLGFQPRGPELLPPPSRPEEAEGSPGPYTRGRRTQSSTMLLSGDRNPSKGDVAAEPLMCSLPELYAFVQNFSKENTKLNRLNTHSISPSEAQKIFSQNLNALGETDVREDDSQPLLTCKVVRKDERPESMTELLHRSLLSSPLYPLERLSRSQRRISQHGIPPPSYTFPYEILISSSTGSPAADAKKEVQGIRILCRLGIPAVSPEKFIFEDRISKYVLVDPGN